MNAGNDRLPITMPAVIGATTSSWRGACAVMLALLLVGGHSAGLQLLAWTTMFIERVQTASVAEAARSTFDGSAPCRLCLAVQALDATSPQDIGTSPTPDAPLKQAAKPHLLAPDVPGLPRLPRIHLRRMIPPATTWRDSIVRDLDTPPPRA